MPRSLGRRTAVLFLLVAILMAPWAAAEPQADRGTASPHLLAQLWSWLSALWSEGCMLDPSGRCGGTPAPAQIDEGCMIDPDGGCRGGSAPAQPDAGCMLDPNGGCRH